jgi:hypothetical protein
MALIVPGTCRYCGCTEEEPCSLCQATKGECAWYDQERTVCAGAGCVRAEKARLRSVSYELVKSKYAGWGYGAILKDLRKQRRRNKRRRAA